METSQNKQVAVKENLALDAWHVDQFKREARLLALLDHKNLLYVIDFLEHDRFHYIIMEFIEGENLRNWGMTHSPPVGEVLSIADTLCDVLAYLHSCEVIHCDVEPSNIILQPDGKARLVDFGSACTTLFPFVQPRLLDITPGYSPPELYGEGPFDPRIDQYSLAATIYWLLTGCTPLENLLQTNEELVHKSIRTLNKAVPIYVEKALSRALSLKPDHRFPDIFAFRSALGSGN